MNNISDKSIKVLQAVSKNDFSDVNTLWRAYHKWLDYEACFDHFDDELKNLPGTYAAPAGALLLAQDRHAGKTVGIVGLRPKNDNVVEIKRLYILPEYQGRGLGRHLTEICLSIAKTAGYEQVYLETLTKLVAAQYLYKSMGFVDLRNSACDTNSEIIGMEYDVL